MSINCECYFFGDIHYPREGELFTRLLNFLKREKLDIIGICGDILNYGNINYLRKFLMAIHKNTDAKIVAVMGNHDFWLSNTAKKRGWTSWDLVELYKSTFRSFNDHLLWDKEFILDDIAFVGVPGWYDYSFAAWHLGIKRSDLDRGVYRGYQWNDFVYTRFGMRVEDILHENLRLLEKQFRRVINRGIEKVIVLIHFVPLKEFIVVKNHPDDFWNAYLGSPKLGDIIIDYKDIVEFVFFGHVDPSYLSSREIKNNGIRFINVEISKGIENSFILEI